MTTPIPKGFRLFRLMHKPLPRHNTSSWTKRYGVEDYYVGARAVHSSGNVVELVRVRQSEEGVTALVRFSNGALRWVTPAESLWRPVGETQG